MAQLYDNNLVKHKWLSNGIECRCSIDELRQSETYFFKTFAPTIVGSATRTDGTRQCDPTKDRPEFRRKSLILGNRPPRHQHPSMSAAFKHRGPSAGT